jgi:hypothetical protein
LWPTSYLFPLVAETSTSGLWHVVDYRPPDCSAVRFAGMCGRLQQGPVYTATIEPPGLLAHID